MMLKGILTVMLLVTGGRVNCRVAPRAEAAVERRNTFQPDNAWTRKGKLSSIR